MHAYFAFKSNTSIFIQEDSQLGRRPLAATQDHPCERCHCQAVLHKACIGVAKDYQPDFRWQAHAIAVLHESTEHYTIRLMEDSNKLAMHAGRVTIQWADIRLVHALRGEEPVKDK